VRIAQYCHDTSKPLFYVRSVGFYGSCSIQLSHAFPIVDTHPDPDSTADLRLLKPWPSLIEYASGKSRDLEKMADHEHGHIPYLVLMLHYLNAWKQCHEGLVPSSYKEKTEFRAFLREGMRTKNPEGGEENFEEAVGAVLKNLNEPSPSSAVREVFSAPECLDLTSKVRFMASSRRLLTKISRPTFG
jgi:NEDD8-activating enzyme E1 regulatory subunit